MIWSEFVERRHVGAGERPPTISAERWQAMGRQYQNWVTAQSKMTAAEIAAERDSNSLDDLRVIHQLPIIVCRVQSAEGPRDYVTCLDEQHLTAHGLPVEAVLGVVQRPLNPGEGIVPANFNWNRSFVDFMHNMIARRGPKLSGVRGQARRQRDGWLYIVDQRTPNPQVSIPPEDIVGAFQVRDGQILPDSYHPSQSHVLLSNHGFVRLGPELQACLLEELRGLSAS
jgi:hypothetical protein